MTDITRASAQTTQETQLVRVFAGTIGGIPANVCDARELHAYLENGDEFAHWIKARVEKYGFQEDQDFAIAWGNSQAKRGGHNRKDYHLTLDMAKELSMVENNDRGREARRYFIQKEREALAAAGQQVPISHAETLLPSEQQTLSEIVHRKAEPFGDLAGKALAEIWSRLHRKFRVAKYSQLPRTQLSDAIIYVTQMELRTTGGIPQHAAREQLSSRDHSAIRRAIWFISNRFRNDNTWSQAMWAQLRAELDTPAPQTFYADQLPAIAELLTDAMRHAAATSDLISEIETAAARRILKKREPAEIVLAELRQRAAEFDDDALRLTPELPRWCSGILLAVGDRSISVDHPYWNGAEGRAA